MRFKLGLTLAVITLAAFALPAWTHHSHGHYVDTFTDLEGIVKEVHLVVPHSWVYLEVKDAKGGEPQIWALEATGRVGLERSGVTRDYVKPGFKHDEVMKYISITNHMWSGFNMLAHLPTWKKLPAGIQTSIDRNVAKYVQLQRQDQQKLNDEARAALGRKLAMNEADAASFRPKLSSVYASWKEKLGSKCWSLLQKSALL